MNFFGLVFLSLVSILFGIILTLAIQYYVLFKYLKKGSTNQSKKISSEAYSLPEALKEQLQKRVDVANKPEESSLAVNLMLQFLFHELRYSESIKKWLYKKLSLEFDELLTKTTTGKLFDSIKIKDMHLGSQFPDIKNVSVEKVTLSETNSYINALNLSLDLDYRGNFLLSVEAKMKFGKTANISIKVNQVSGLVRLQFTRLPYTHWSASFYKEPTIELAVSSQFQGRQLQSNITNLIINQIKKAIKRKHTLPNYKIRYKPFFVKMDPGQIDMDDNEITPQGQLEMNCIEVTRLAIDPNVNRIYCSFCIDEIPTICILHKQNSVFILLELTIAKFGRKELGVLFKQDGATVIVDSIVPDGLAAEGGMKQGDVLLAVDSKVVGNINQISKLIKTVTTTNFSVRIQRLAHNYTFKNQEKTEHETPIFNTSSIDESEIAQIEEEGFTVVEKDFIEPVTPKKCMEKILKPSESVSKLTQTVGNFTLRKRKSSVERISSEISSRKATKSEIKWDDITEVYKGQAVTPAPIVSFNDDYLFKLKDKLKFLNVNIWGVTNEKDILLGYINIPLNQILHECYNSMLGHYTKSYSLLPPNQASLINEVHPLKTHSGFEQVFCFGDILLTFMWTNNEPIKIAPKEQVFPAKQDSTPNLSIHDFVRTQFHRTTHCDFCSKKIWLKDAVQCRDCALSCHKKCMSKCQVNTPCKTPDKRHLKRESFDFTPEITTTEVCGDSDYPFETKPSLPGLKRVNSANNLVVPGLQFSSCQSKSLPPSPQHTPNRKQSLIAFDPFSLCPLALEEVYQQVENAPDIIERLLDQILLCALDESLMDAAKESGKQLYAGLPQELKLDKINLMVTELKKALDAATLDHKTLQSQLTAAESEVAKTKLIFVMGNIDSKIHALSVLMLHFCSGLQQAQDKII